MKYDIYAEAVWQLFIRGCLKQLKNMNMVLDLHKLKKESKLYYRNIIQRTPSIGGMSNSMTIIIIWSALFIAIYKSSKGKMSDKDLGRMIESSMENSTVLKLFSKSLKVFSEKSMKLRNQIALDSQKRIYKADWVCDFVRGDRLSEFGINYYECGVCKLAKQEGCPNIVKYMCKVDYIMAKYMGAKLTRTKTLANGDKLCDFWYEKESRLK